MCLRFLFGFIGGVVVVVVVRVFYLSLRDGGVSTPLGQKKRERERTLSRETQSLSSSSSSRFVERPCDALLLLRQSVVKKRERGARRVESAEDATLGKLRARLSV